MGFERVNSIVESILKELPKTSSIDKELIDKFASSVNSPVAKQLAENFSHDTNTLSNIANRTGYVNLYHGTPGEFANKIVDNPRIFAWETADDMLKNIADTYGITISELKNKTGAGHLVQSYGRDVARMSTAPAPIASSWAEHFPHGEVMSMLNNKARVYVDLKEKLGRIPSIDEFDKYYDDLFDLARTKTKDIVTDISMPDIIGLPDKLPSGRSGGSIVELTVDSRSIPERFSLVAKRLLDSNYPYENKLASWNGVYKDIKLSPNNIKNARVVMSGIKNR